MSNPGNEEQEAGTADPLLVAVFRVDSSSVIGSGHVMRCLTLAQEIRARGGECLFVCRPAPGDFIGEIQRSGFKTLVLEAIESANDVSEESALDHSEWLVGGWRIDVIETLQNLSELSFDWLVIDHYGIDHQWESKFLESRPATKLACIDDLADRRHLANLIIDQNLGRVQSDYEGLVPRTCKALVGTRYALLRSEFLEARADSLARRLDNHKPRRIFVNLGGVDLDNVTVRVIEALAELPDAHDIKVDVVLGGSAPHEQSVRIVADEVDMDVSIHINTTRVAHLMALADVAIGAGGGTSWERCSLGLPSMVVELAANQRNVVAELAQHDVAYLLDKRSLTASIGESWAKLQDANRMRVMSENASKLVRGDGAALVADAFMEG